MKSPIPAANGLQVGPPPAKSAGDRGGHSRRLMARLSTLGVVAAIAAVLSPAAILAATGDWVQFRESPAHQAHNTSEAAISDTNVHALGLAWTGATGAAVNSSPAIANGVTYVGSNDGKLYAFAVGCATNGSACTPAWSYPVGTDVQSSPAVSGGVVYAGASDGKLYAFHIVADHLALTPANATIVAGATQVYRAEGYDSLNADLGDVTAMVTFSIDGTGTCTSNVCGSTVGGTYTVTGTMGTATGTTMLRVSISGATYVARTVAVAVAVAVAGQGGVLANAVAVTGNLTVTGQTLGGFLYLGPNANNNPTSSTLNFPKGDNRANGVTVALNSIDGSLSATYVAASLSAHTAVVFDVTGYFVK